METAETARGERTAVCKWHPWCVLSFDSWEEKASVLHSTYIWVWFFIFYKEKALACCLNMHACTSVHGHTRTAKAWIEATPCFCYWGFSAAPSAVLPQGSSREEKGHERRQVHIPRGQGLGGKAGSGAQPKGQCLLETPEGTAAPTVPKRQGNQGIGASAGPPQS